MKNVAVALLTKDHTELTEQTIVPLQTGEFDLWCIDGSRTPAGAQFILDHGSEKYSRFNVRGGAGAGLVYALTEMLKHDYAYVGICEQDTLLPVDWFDRIFELFERGRSDGLEVGAVSARCYEDRILFQRDGYAVCHNLGAGHILFTRQAAEIVLNAFRSGWTTDNRRIFCQLSGVDIGPLWCFKNNDHPTTADWKWDSDLAAHGLASLALTPSHVEMIGQHPPLAEQGLVIAREPVSDRIDNTGFERYRESLQAIRDGHLKINVETTFSFNPDLGAWNYLPHQLHMIGGKFSGDWRFRETRGNGEFGWVSGNGENQPTLIVPVYGLASLLISGGKHGGQIEVIDEHSGYTVSPFVPPEGDNMQALQIPLPGGVTQRNIRVTALSPGLCLLRLTCQNKQPHDPTKTFDHSVLPVPV